jgi:hypothetical protein
MTNLYVRRGTRRERGIKRRKEEEGGRRRRSNRAEGEGRMHRAHKVTGAARIPIEEVLAEMRGDTPATRQYRQAWEIMPFLEHWVENKKSENFIPLY